MSIMCLGITAQRDNKLCLKTSKAQKMQNNNINIHLNIAIFLK